MYRTTYDLGLVTVLVVINSLLLPMLQQPSTGMVETEMSR